MKALILKNLKAFYPIGTDSLSLNENLIYRIILKTVAKANRGIKTIFFTIKKYDNSFNAAELERLKSENREMIDAHHLAIPTATQKFWL